MKAVPPPTRTLHASPGERGSITSGSSAWHLVQDAFVLLPVGTTHHGTPKYDSVGKVQDVLPSILAQGEGPGNATRLRAKATQTRLSAWVRNPAACDGLFFCHNEGLMRSASPHVPYPDCTLFYHLWFALFNQPASAPQPSLPQRALRLDSPLDRPRPTCYTRKND